MKNARMARKTKPEQIHSKQVRDEEADLVAVISVKELHQQRRAHDKGQNDHDAAHQRRKLGQVGGPLRIGKRIVHFVSAAVALLPRQDAGEVRDHRDQKQVERSGDYFEQPVGDRQESVSEAFGVAVNQRGHAVQQGKRGDDDERRRLHQAPEFDFYRAPELQPLRAGAEISGCHRNRRGGDRNAVF